MGEGATEADGRHGEVVALAAAGERARGATLYVTMEPCAHHGTTPPCVDAVLAAGIARVVAGSLDPNPEAGGGLARLQEQGVETELADSFEARRQNEAWRTWTSLGAAVRGLQGRGHARRPRHRPRRALGLRRGVAPARARAPRRVRRGRGRDGHGPAREPPPRRARRRRTRGSRAGSRSGTGRSPRAPSSSSAPARSRTSCARSPTTASSRCCSRAARRWRVRSSRRGSSTSCSSSSRRRSRATARGPPRPGAPAPLSRLTSRQVGEDVLLEAYLREPYLSSCSPGSSGRWGRSRRSTDGRLVVESATAAELGDSVAIDGVCLTVVERRAAGSRSTSCRRRSSRVKEFGGARQRRAGAEGRRAARRPSRAGARRRRRGVRVGRARGRRRAHAGRALAPELLRYCVEKGSIAVDGRLADGRGARRRRASRSR